MWPTVCDWYNESRPLAHFYRENSKQRNLGEYEKCLSNVCRLNLCTNLGWLHVAQCGPRECPIQHNIQFTSIYIQCFPQDFWRLWSGARNPLGGFEYISFEWINLVNFNYQNINYWQISYMKKLLTYWYECWWNNVRAKLNVVEEFSESILEKMKTQNV